jgi:hypothetical protein
MKMDKSKKKELRKIFEKEKGEEYVEWISNQPTYSPFEFIELKWVCK